jgi:hypothetical protein
MAASSALLRKFASKSVNAKATVKVYLDNGATTTMTLAGGDAYSRKDVEALIAKQVGVKVQTKGSDGQSDEQNITNRDVLTSEQAAEFYGTAFPAPKGKNRVADTTPEPSVNGK